jgi:hypothetical protein
MHLLLRGYIPDYVAHAVDATDADVLDAPDAIDADADGSAADSGHGWREWRTAQAHNEMPIYLRWFRG